MNSPELSKRSTELAQHQAYLSTLAQVQQSITQARARAALSVNAELTGLYWRVGERIAQLQQSQGWGSAVVDQMARDLARAHPGIAGFSRTNLFAMRQLYLFFSQKFEFVPQPVGQMPWGHVRVLLGKVKEVDVALWYAQSHAEHGWSREMLSWQIDQQLHARIGAAPNNFESTLPADRSDLVTQTIKDPYVFDFLNLQATAVERDIENQLTQQITRFLLELGKGFAFLGRQYPLHVNDKDYFLDLLFYHTRLKCYVVVELKAGEFIPEHVGKMNFYLSAVDDQLRAADDQPSIGLILCKNKDRLDVEYALRDIQKPIGVSSYITKQIPIDVQSQLPSVEELEKELLSISASSSGEQEAQK
jgi:predicted nuclease of restriction endonuclease-like (RecB) superfamily